MALTKLSTDVIDLSGNTEALTIPKGVTSNVSLTVDYLVVAGGGSGTIQGAGGGGGLRTSYGSTSGGGQVSEQDLELQIGVSYNIIIGIGGVDTYLTGGSSGSGTNSTLSGGVITTITSTGGGGAGATSGDVASATGKDGGSGGGAGNNTSGSPGSAVTSPVIQGYNGGTALTGWGSQYPGGGGGGAGGLGGNTSGSNVAGNGGAQFNSDITVTTIGYAGGGGGSIYGSGTVGTNSSSGGVAAPSSGSSSNGGSAPNNLGGGGGGANHISGTTGITGGAGGSGIIILRYPNIFTATYTAGTGGAADSEVTVGTDKYIKITAGTGTVAFSGTPITSGRPSSPTEGLMRENTTTSKMEFYDGSLWQEITDTVSTYVSGLIPSANFNTVLYPGDGVSGNSITDVGFQPDMVWVKATDAAYDPVLASVVNTQDYYLTTSEDYAESVGNGRFSSFDTDGFTVTNGTSASNPAVINNKASTNYVSWNWKAGGPATTITAGTEGNTITSDVSANVAAGFSIVSYTGNSTAGATISHGLSSAPELIIQKRTQATANWFVYSSGIGNTKYLVLDANIASSSAVNIWNNTDPTDKVFTVSAQPDVNGYASIAYCFHSIPGYSKIGFYVGNLNSTGPTVYTGFKPAWLMIKSTGADNWIMLDNKRSTSNPRQAALFANLSDAEYPTYGANVNFLDTGFQIVNTDGITNALGVTYIYMTFSE